MLEKKAGCYFFECMLRSRSSIYTLVGSPVRNSDKYDTVEKMMRIYVGIHDRVEDLRSDKIYGVETIKVVSGFVFKMFIANIYSVF